MLHYVADELSRVMACSGSRHIGASVPARTLDPKHQEQRDLGDAAHFMAEQAASGKFSLEELVDRKAPNGVYMTQEMFEHVEFYLMAIANVSNVEIEVETSWSAAGFEVGGRADHIRLDETQTYLDITDLKYGWGIVEPENNWTLISHAVGVVLSRGLQKWPDTVNLTIVQPRPHHRLGNIRTWTITGAQLAEFYAQMCGVLVNPLAVLTTNDYCRGCRAITVCPAARKVDLNTVDITETAYEDDLPDEQLGDELATLQIAFKRLKGRIEATEDQVKHRASKGAVVPGFAIEQDYARETWRDEVTPEMLKLITGVDATKSTLLTPGQLQRKGVSQDVIKAFTHRPSRGVKLIKASAHNRAKAMFGEKT